MMMQYAMMILSLYASKLNNNNNNNNNEKIKYQSNGKENFPFILHWALCCIIQVSEWEREKKARTEKVEKRSAGEREKNTVAVAY